MKRFFFLILACCFPWVIFLIQGFLGYAILALCLQASMIAWIPASIWAYQASAEMRKIKAKPKPKKKTKSPESSASTEVV